MDNDLAADLAFRAQRLKELGIATKPAVWLRPQPVAAGGTDTRGSKIGGAIAWPPSVPWPSCEIAEEHIDEGPTYRGGEAFVAVAQFVKADFPEIKFPEHTDILQILWCPHSHLHPTIEFGGIGPLPKVFWHSLQEALDAPNPVPKYPANGLVPVECTFNPIRLEDAPPLGYLTESQQREFSLDYKTYEKEAGSVPGTKLLGCLDYYPSEPPVCKCHREMTLLLTIPGTEVSAFDGPWWRRYSPHPPSGNVIHSAGLGDLDGKLLIFYCSECAGTPTEYRIQNH
jgi:hypothetical protein